VIGVGAMGMGVAKALLDKGFAVIVRDIVPEREAEAATSSKTRDSPYFSARRKKRDCPRF